MNKKIDDVIVELSTIGKRYLKPKDTIISIFFYHTNQDQAKKLENLQATTANKYPDEKMMQVTKVVAEIYYSIKQLGTLMHDIHTCLSTSVDFTTYCETVSNPSLKRMKEGSYDVLPSIDDYRKAIDPNGLYAPPSPKHIEPSYTS